MHRGAVVDVTGWAASETPTLPGGATLESLVVAMPLGTTICPGAAMTFDNVTGLAENTEVDIYMNGVKISKHYAPYGDWAKISEGVVDAGGATITTKEGMDIHLLERTASSPSS